MKIMKRICTILLMALFINGSVIAAEKLKLVSLSVPTMNCAMCPITVSKSLMNVQGVQTADASLAKGVVEIPPTIEKSFLLLHNSSASFSISSLEETKLFSVRR